MFSDHDYYFFYVHEVDVESFKEMKKQLKLKVSYQDYPTMLIKMFNNSIKDQAVYQTFLALNSDGTALLAFT